MTADSGNTDMDESTMYLTAVGRSSHGRVRGFGSMLQHKVNAATTRARTKHTASSVSGLTDNGGQIIRTREELEIMLADRDRRLEEERALTDRKMATYDFYFSQLFNMYGGPRPTSEDGVNSPGTQHGVMGNLPSLQGQCLTNPPFHGGASPMQTAISQGLAVPTQPNLGGGFQALLNQTQAENDDNTTGEDEWFGQSTFNANQH